MIYNLRFNAMLAALLVVLTVSLAMPYKAWAQDAMENPTTMTTAATNLPQPPAPLPTTETVKNPYGLDSLWRQGDFVARGTLLILVIMSIGSWYIGVVKALEQSKILKQAGEAKQKFWQSGSIQSGASSLHEDSAFRFIAEESLKASDSHGKSMLEQIDFNSWVGMSIQRSIETISNRLQNGLAFLATVGSTAPFVGLFGTVWGIYHALTAIGIAGQASIDKVAGPVGESLIMTAMGLAVAVPAVLGYNALVRRNKIAMEKVRYFSGELHMVLLSGGPVQGKDI